MWGFFLSTRFDTCLVCFLPARLGVQVTIRALTIILRADLDDLLVLALFETSRHVIH